MYKCVGYLIAGLERSQNGFLVAKLLSLMAQTAWSIHAPIPENVQAVFFSLVPPLNVLTSKCQPVSKTISEKVRI